MDPNRAADLRLKLVLRKSGLGLDSPAVRLNLDSLLTQDFTASRLESLWRFESKNALLFYRMNYHYMHSLLTAIWIRLDVNQSKFLI